MARERVTTVGGFLLGYGLEKWDASQSACVPRLV